MAAPWTGGYSVGAFGNPGPSNVFISSGAHLCLPPAFRPPFAGLPPAEAASWYTSADLPPRGREDS
eukprot:3198930-Pyramimonas_sp.AAC.1